AQTLVVGEVGLGGEIRPAPKLTQRLDEAAKLGFVRAITPPKTAINKNIEVNEFNNIAAIKSLFTNK
ncbi:DNA repair protein RadA, partial [Candidatus Falkowbacteria bacterium]|nr:DNA repair protein RadA [Candidatus Falkowbacteria bacterium]